MVVVCDKHGGRNYYGRLLQQQFPDPLVEVHGESSRKSVYRWGPERSAGSKSIFAPAAKQFLPAALASMTSKYLRELAMRAFNDFWCTRVPRLAPTAGYPGDARRFATPSSRCKRRMGIDDQNRVALTDIGASAPFEDRLPCCSTSSATPSPDNTAIRAIPDDALAPADRKGTQAVRASPRSCAAADSRPRWSATSPLRALPANGRGDLPSALSRAGAGRTGQSATGQRFGAACRLVERAGAEELAWVGHAPDVDALAAALLGGAPRRSLSPKGPWPRSVRRGRSRRRLGPTAAGTSRQP